MKNMTLFGILIAVVLLVLAIAVITILQQSGNYNSQTPEKQASGS